MQVSEDSLRRFVGLWLSIDRPLSCYSQTLTFASDARDYDAAKKLLYKALANIGKQFPEVIMLWVAGMQERAALHFHVIMPFYAEVAPERIESLRKAYWKAWNRLQGGAASPLGNLWKHHENRFQDRQGLIRYYAYELADLPRGWWGVRNATLLKSHRRKVSAREITNVIENISYLRALFGSKRRVGEEKPRQITMRLVKRMKDQSVIYLRDWENFKRQTTGQQGKVTDRSFCFFLKAGLIANTLPEFILDELKWLWRYPA